MTSRSRRAIDGQLRGRARGPRRADRRARRRAVRRRLAVTAALALGAALALPASALAHGLVGKQDLPIPRWLFAWAAAVVLVVSFVALAVLWPRPRLEGARERAVLTCPAALEVLCGALGVGAFVAVVWAGYAGTQTATANLAPTVIYVVFWVAIPFATLLLGDVFAAFNPWRAAARGAAWLYGRARRGGEPPAPMAYPAWLGRWPAALGILAFAWVELVYVNKDDPSQLATMALLYAAVQLVGMSLYGIEAWSRNADAFGVYFRLFSMLSPLHWRARTLYVRPPLAGAPDARCRPGHGAAAVHDDRHRQLRRPLAGTHLDGPGRDRPAPAAALHQPRLQRRGGARDHLHDRAADDGGPDQRPLSPGRARHALDRGRRRHRPVTALRALADPDRPGLRRGALLLAADVPGTGDGLPHLRSARPRLGPVRHRDDDDQLQPRRRQRRLVRAGRRARARPRVPA